MNRLKINPEQPETELLQKAAGFLKNGGVIAHATETVYGLAVCWNNWPAIQKVSQIKRRLPAQAYSIMVDITEDIMELIGWDSPQLRNLLESVFPGPITLLLTRRRRFELDYWNQFEEIGFRLPDHRLSRELVNLSGGPLITTSANLSGEKPPASAEEISQEISAKIDLILDSGVCPFQFPSTVIQVNLSNREYRILRSGAFSIDRFSEIFKTIW
jgi:L-threonylcarbamoyladenylate synthase